MHDYTIDKHPKEKILFALSLITIAITAAANSFVSFLGVSLGLLSTSITMFSVFSIFILVYIAFDKFLWKCKVLRKIFLVPDIGGKWICEGVTLIKAGSAVNHKWEGEITITQSWSKILIHLQTKESNSDSNSASICSVAGVGYKLLYQYGNNPKASNGDLKNHSGAAELNFNEQCDAAEGNYYTDQHRSTVGKINLRRK